MPETNFERVVLFLGLCAIGVLGFLVVRRDHHDARASATSTAVSTHAATTTASASTPTVATSTSSPPSTQAVQLAHVVLTAARGDCWVVVRFRSAHGKVLFAGTIARGTKKRFTGARLWLSLGAAGNLTGRLNGATFAIPPGSPTLLATAARVRVLAFR